MLVHEIPNAFLIRALARGHAELCDGCGSRMYVKGASGLCPYCLSGHPPRAVARPVPTCADEPFAPRLGGRAGAHGWTRILTAPRRERLRRETTAALALAAGEPDPS